MSKLFFYSYYALLTMLLELAVQTLRAALERNHHPKNLLLHSNQGSQYTSHTFIDYCKEKGIQQSISKAGCPYGNSLMESFYGTFKAEFISKHHFSLPSFHGRLADLPNGRKNFFSFPFAQHNTDDFAKYQKWAQKNRKLFLDFLSWYVVLYSGGYSFFCLL